MSHLSAKMILGLQKLSEESIFIRNFCVPTWCMYKTSILFPNWKHKMNQLSPSPHLKVKYITIDRKGLHNMRLASLTNLNREQFQRNLFFCGGSIFAWSSFPGFRSPSWQKIQLYQFDGMAISVPVFQCKRFRRKDSRGRSSNRTSQTYAYCYEQVVQPKTNAGKSFIGLFKCMYLVCTAFVARKSIQERDTQVAAAINYRRNNSNSFKETAITVRS
jgi:hypothetical protein